MGISLKSPTQRRSAASAVKSRPIRSSAAAPSDLRERRRFFGRAIRPWRAMEASTDFFDTARPARRSCTRTLGDP